MITMFFYPQVGGAEKQAHKLSKKLIEKGIDVKVTTGWWFTGTPAQETIDGVPITRCFTFWQMFGIKGLRKFGAYTYLLTLFVHLLKHRHQYDVIHIHQLAHHAFAGVVAGKLLGKRSLIKLGNSGRASDIKVMQQNRQIWGTKQMLLKIQQYCDRIVAISGLIEQELVENGFRPEQIIRIPNGVQIDQITPKASYAITDQVLLTYIGRLHWQKGADVLISALNKVSELRPELRWRLKILGVGPLSSQLKRQVQAYGLADRIEFCGLVDNVLDCLIRTDIFVLPSRAEGLSNALLEAMSAGVPCLVTDIEANAEIIQDGYNGLLTPDEDEETMCRSILRLADDEALRSKLGKRARQTVVDRYSLDAIADRYIKLYSQLLAYSTTTERQLPRN